MKTRLLALALLVVTPAAALAANTTSVLRGGICVNEVLVDPNGTLNFDTDGNGTADDRDEFVELYNLSAGPIDISGLKLWDAGSGNWFTFPGGTTLPASGYAVVVIAVQSGGTLPPHGLAFDAALPGSIIANSGDNVVLLDPTANRYVQLRFDNDPADNPLNYPGFPAGASLAGTVESWGIDIPGVSLTRNPSGDTTVVAHNTVSAEQASPGYGLGGTPPILDPAVVNEFVADHTGVDTHEYVEIRGTPSTDYSSAAVLVLDPTGVVAAVITPGTTDAGGRWVSGFTSGQLPDTTISLLLVHELTGAVGNDLDTDDDGVLDATPWTSLWDSVAVFDGTAGHRTYGTPVLAANFDGVATPPGGASRIPDGADTDAVADWRRNDFDGAGLPGFTGTPDAGEANNTPGAVNTQVASGYYGGVDDSSQAALRLTLHETVDDHTRFPYTASTTDTWDILEQADQDPVDSGSILDLYKNATYTKAGGGNSYYNREHSWPNSYGFPDDDGLSNYPYTDCHHLFLSDISYNGDRGNMPFGSCDAASSEYVTLYNHGVGGGSGTYPGNSNWRSVSLNRWETWVARRGDVARALFYLDVRYEGGTHGVTGYPEPDLILTDNPALIQTTGGNASVAYMGLLSTLLEWHQQDPVDARELNRNEVVYSYQGNRNPFVDHPEWVECVYLGTGCGASLFADGFETGTVSGWSSATP